MTEFIEKLQAVSNQWCRTLDLADRHAGFSKIRKRQSPGIPCVHHRTPSCALLNTFHNKEAIFHRFASLKIGMNITTTFTAYVRVPNKKL
jgi:hypothetical protein